MNTWEYPRDARGGFRRHANSTPAPQQSLSPAEEVVVGTHPDERLLRDYCEAGSLAELEERLPPAELGALDEHLLACPDCQSRMESLCRSPGSGDTRGGVDPAAVDDETLAMALGGTVCPEPATIDPEVLYRPADVDWPSAADVDTAGGCDVGSTAPRDDASGRFYPRSLPARFGGIALWGVARWAEGPDERRDIIREYAAGPASFGQMAAALEAEPWTALHLTPQRQQGKPSRAAGPPPRRQLVLEHAVAGLTAWAMPAATAERLRVRHAAAPPGGLLRATAVAVDGVTPGWVAYLPLLPAAGGGIEAEGTVPPAAEKTPPPPAAHVILEVVAGASALPPGAGEALLASYRQAAAEADLSRAGRSRTLAAWWTWAKEAAGSSLLADDVNEAVHAILDDQIERTRS